MKTLLKTLLLLLTMSFSVAAEKAWTFYMESYIGEDLNFEYTIKNSRTGTWSCEAGEAYRYRVKNPTSNQMLPMTLTKPSVPSGKKVVFLSSTEIYSFPGAPEPTFVIEEVNNEIQITRFDD